MANPLLVILFGATQGWMISYWFFCSLMSFRKRIFSLLFLLAVLCLVDISSVYSFSPGSDIRRYFIIFGVSALISFILSTVILGLGRRRRRKQLSGQCQ